MTKKNTFNWGKASMIAGAGVFFYLAFRNPAESAVYKPVELPFNPSLDDPDHWAYQLRPGSPNPGYDMANYSRDVHVIGEDIKLGLTQNDGQDTLLEGYKFCEMYGPFNDLQSPYGPSTGFVIEVFKPLTKEQYQGVDEVIKTDFGEYNHFFERLFIPIWLHHPQDQKFADTLAAPPGTTKGVSPVIGGRVKGDNTSINAYDPGAWIARQVTASTEYQPCSFDDRPNDLIIPLPWAVEQARKYESNRDARYDL